MKIGIIVLCVFCGIGLLGCVPGWIKFEEYMWGILYGLGGVVLITMGILIGIGVEFC